MGMLPHKNRHRHKSMLLILAVGLLLLLAEAEAADLDSQRAALLTLRSSVGGRTLFWNATNQSPCNWAGVQCDHDRVVELHLPGVALSGQIPTGIFSNLTHLRTLSLRFNALTGSLPSDLASCVNLRNLYIQRNLLSGQIPDFLFTLPDMVRLNMGFNNFSGPISTSFNNFTRLKTLFLENNHLSGSIPQFKAFTLDQFNVSNNVLNGSVPVNLQTFSQDSFLGNSLCGRPLSLCPGTATDASSPFSADDGNIKNKNKNKLSGGAIAGIVIGSVVGLLLLVFLLIFLCRNKSSKNTSAVDVATIKHPESELPHDKSISDLENNGNGYSTTSAAAAAAAAVAVSKVEANGNGNTVAAVGAKKLVFFGNAARAFDLEDLLRASAEVLGKGTFGTAYKAVLESGPVVAVKRLKDVTITEKEFREKIEAVGAIDHQSLVPLRAYYFSRDEKLLVYDYMSMGSLSALLHGNKGAGRTPLNWEMRSGIALGAAKGIEYLHSQGPNVSHGNIKSSNILLTKSYDARVSDFGLARGAPPVNTLPVAYQAWTSLAVPDWLNKGDNSWQMISATLVGIQSMPGLVILYGSIVKKKWAVNSAFMALYAFAAVIICWVTWAYKMSFGEKLLPFWGKAGPALGQKFLIRQAGLPATVHYHHDGSLETAEIEPFYPMATMVWFQCVFAAISLVILAGSVLARMNFKAWMMFVPLWLTFSYTIGAFSLWGGGFLFQWGVMDYSGGYVIHLSSGIAGFTAAYWVGPRSKKDRERFPPNNVLLTLAGAGLLWMGWAGFNGGDPYSANIDSSMAVLNTNICAATSLLVWTWLDVIFFKKPSVIGAVQGMITGLVCITPGAGLVQGWAAIVMGVLSGSVPWYTMMVLGKKISIFQKVDDTLAVFHTHAVAGLLGGVLTGLFAEPQLSTLFLPVTNSKGGVYGGSGGVQILKQIVGALFIVGWNIVATSIICLVISFIVPLRMTEEELLIGDDAVHGEEAYALWGDGEKLSLYKDDTTQHGMASSGVTQVV